MQVWPRASERGRHNGSAARRKGPADGMKGRASGPASRSGFSAASSAVRHEASSASRRTFSFAARTGAFLPVRAALFSRPCRNALPVGRCLPAGVCPCGGAGEGRAFSAAAFQGRAPFFPEGDVGEKSSSFFSAVGIRTPCACGAPGGRALHGSFRPGRGAAFFQRKFHGRRTETCRPVPR